MIGHARHDENGKYSNGLAGDQKGDEVCVTAWYSRPWNVVLRCTDPIAREKIAVAMEQACNNNKIGYDQNQRTTLYKYAKEVGWDISKVKTACETDCSALVAVCVNAAGISVSKDIYTGNERDALFKTGKFIVLTEKKYTGSDAYLLRGDVLLYEGHHTAINLTTGHRVEKSKTGWERQSDGSWKYLLNGSYVKDKWLEIKNRWYAFDGSGKMITGWFESKKKWYYLNPADGAMLSGQWIKYKGDDYYLGDDGVMVTNCYVQSKDKSKYYWIGNDGKWNSGYDTTDPPKGVRVVKK